jgi:hypothetical protein
MKRHQRFFVTALILVGAFALGGCETRLADPEAVTAVRVVWFPAHNLRRSPLDIEVDPNLVGLFIDRLNLSQRFDAIWNITDTPLYEGRYEITVYKKAGGKDFYQLGGESVLYAPATKTYYQNKDLLLFVYENLFLELIKRKITIP